MLEPPTLPEAVVDGLFDGVQCVVVKTGKCVDVVEVVEEHGVRGTHGKGPSGPLATAFALAEDCHAVGGPVGGARVVGIEAEMLFSGSDTKQASGPGVTGAARIIVNLGNQEGGLTVVRAKLDCGLRFGGCLFQTAEDKGVAGIVVLGLEEPRVAAVERDGEAGATLRAISSWMVKTSPGSQSKTPDQSW